MNTQSTFIDSGTRRNMRAYTSQILDEARDLIASLSMVQKRCTRALREADLMDASNEDVPLTSLAPFHEVIASSVGVLDCVSVHISDLRKNARSLAAVLFKLPDPPEVNDEETEND